MESINQGVRDVTYSINQSILISAYRHVRVTSLSIPTHTSVKGKERFAMMDAEASPPEKARRRLASRVTTRHSSAKTTEAFLVLTVCKHNGLAFG